MRELCPRYVAIVDAKVEMQNAGYCIMGIMHTATITNENLSQAIEKLQTAVKLLKKAAKLPRL
jgi:hypothetical protein